MRSIRIVMMSGTMMWILAHGAGGTHAESTDFNQPVPLGKMTAFWRYRPVVDRWLKGRLGFMRVPDYLCDPSLSFPYQKKPEAEEIPFADHLTVVRLLGGWNPAWNTGEAAERPSRECDLAYRDANGQIQYRWELLGPRLDHYVRGGYGLTLVLDNIPWCFPASPKEASYGQAAPPANYEEWSAFIREMCKQLAQRYGQETANRFRFRMGTENQGRGRFSGAQEDYFKYYDYSTSAIKTVLPDAEVGPFNVAGPGEDTSAQNVSFHALVGHCLKGRNYATGKTGSPMDFASTSLYMVADAFLNGKIITADPGAKAAQRGSLWDKIAAASPRLRNISREVHEFGILGEGDAGARGAAWAFHTIIALRERGLNRLWNWGAFDSTGGKEPQHLLAGQGWVYQILEHTVGGDTYVLPVAAEPALRRENEGLGFGDPALIAQAANRNLTATYQTMHKSIAVVKGSRTFIITSSYNEDRFVTQPQRLTVTLPAKLSNYGAGAKVGMVCLTRDNSAQAKIRRDLEEAGLLTEEYMQNPMWLGTIREMGGAKGVEFVCDNFEKYARIVQDSLTLKPFTGKTEAGRGLCRFCFDLTPSALMVIVVDGR